MRHRDIEIPTESNADPFTNCKLSRKPYAEVLTQIVSSYSSGFVLALNNEWGAGKTTFIRMWRQHLINNEFKTLYFNAWKNDFENDVLVALISELKELKEPGTEKAFRNLIKKGASLSRKVGPKILKATLKRVGVDGDEVLEILQGTAELGFEALENEIKSYTQRKDSLVEFRNSLETFVEKADPDKPIIFFIDELDRCRPNYAVKVLEEVKHLFSVPGIVFVLSIDKKQLGHAVRGVYGSEMINAEEYLRRFIDLEYSLPQPEIKAICDYLYDYFSFSDFVEHEERMKIKEFQWDRNQFKDFSSILLSSVEANFRQVERLFALARVGLRTFRAKSFLFPRLYFLLVYLKVFRPSLYRIIENKHIEVQELIIEVEELYKVKVGTESGDSIAITSAELAISYHNYYYENTYPKKELMKENSEPEVLYFDSKFDSTEHKRLLKGVYNTLRYTGGLKFKIDVLLKKINLTESVIN